MTPHFTSRTKPRLAAKLNLLAAMATIRGDGVFQGPYGTTIKNRKVRQTGGATDVFPWMEELTFGLERVDTNKVKVLNCKARRYGDPQGTAPNQTIYYSCDDKEITFSGDGAGQRICWKWNPTDGLRILDNAQTNDPIDDSTDIYGVVAIFDVTGGMATLATGGIIQCGQVITLPLFTVAGS